MIRKFTGNGLIKLGKRVSPKKEEGGLLDSEDYLKNGSKIHIKKKNRGKFTEYCNGKVTAECIARGKRSKNPLTRRRATFAANSRAWKHQDGGTINYINYFNQ